MCNHCNDHSHHHHHDHPEIVQLMPVQSNLYAVYQTDTALEFSVETGQAGISIVPVLFMGLIRHGDKTMVEGFFASTAIHSCEETDGFKGYASSLAHAEKLYA